LIFRCSLNPNEGNNAALEVRQIETAVQNRNAESITVMGDVQPASPLEVEAFLKLLADIAKRIITEEAQINNERKVG
jgi:hypothetical protein